MIAACIALPLVLLAFQGYASFQTTRINADLEIARTRDIAREQAAKVLETIERSLSEIGEVVRGRSDDEIRAREQFFFERLAVIDKALPQMKSVWVLDADGRPLATSVVSPVAQDPFSERDYFAAHVARDIGTFVGPVLQPRPPFGGAPFFSMSRRRPSEDGRFTGVIQASILPDYFEQFYKQIGFEPGALVMLALTDGVVIASNLSLPVNARLAPDGEFRRRVTQSPEAGLVTARFEVDGVERRVAYQKLDGYPVLVAAGLATDAIFARWMHDFRDLLLIAVPTTLLVLAMLTLVLEGLKRLHAESASRERAEAALRENQRLEALGQLTGGVAHDFNNLLTVIGSSADLLRRPSVPEERRQRYLNAISETVTRATALTSQLLAYARRQPHDRVVFDAARRIAGMGEMLQTLIGSSVELQVHQEASSCLVETDLSQFETAIINLAANARDAMPEGGVLEIAIRPLANLPARFELRETRAGYVAISVADTGQGVPEGQEGRVFEPFFTTKDVGRGTGLGLSQVFGFVKQSRGEIAVDSVSGKGATFTLFLPQATGVEPIAENRPHVASSTTAALRVLLVDDNEAVLQATGEALRARGMTVLTAASAEAALDRLARKGDAANVVLTDIVMPGMSGIELARVLRRDRPDLPVVVTTGYSEAIEREGEGDLDLIRKPYAIDDLVAKLVQVARTHALEVT